MLITLVLTTLASAPSLGDQVRCAELAFSHSAEERDHAAFAALVHPDARFSGGGGVLRGREAVAEGWSVFFTDDGPTIRWAPDSVEVLNSGDLALSQGPYELRTRDPQGKETLTGGRFMSVWQRQDDGRWLIVFDAGTPGVPVETSTVDAVDTSAGQACGDESPEPQRADR
jgi:ketosteroid isomerase-like protein